MSIFVFAALLVALGAWLTFERVALGMIGAREVPVGEAPILHSTLERLAARAGIAKPRLYVIREGIPLSAVAGRGRRSSAVALSATCISACPPAELEGLLAHEVAHVRFRDMPVQTVAAVVAALLLESSRIGGFLQRTLLFVLGPLAAAFVHALVSPKRELAADRLCRGTVRNAARARGRASAARAGGRARAVRRKPGDGTALPDQPVRGARARWPVRDASADRRSCTPAARAGPTKASS